MTPVCQRANELNGKEELTWQMAHSDTSKILLSAQTKARGISTWRTKGNCLSKMTSTSTQKRNNDSDFVLQWSNEFPVTLYQWERMLDESIDEEVNFSVVMTMNMVHMEIIHVQMQSDSSGMHVLWKRENNGDRGHSCELFNQYLNFLFFGKDQYLNFPQLRKPKTRLKIIISRLQMKWILFRWFVQTFRKRILVRSYFNYYIWEKEGQLMIWRIHSWKKR